MKNLRLRRPSPALIIAVIALFVALGGTGYAALQLPRNSVGARELEKNAVTSNKVKDGALKLKDFAAGQIPAGPRGATGPAGLNGKDGKNGLNGRNGIAGQPGQDGQDGQDGASGVTGDV